MNNFKEIINKNPVINLIKPHLGKMPAYIVGGYLRDILLGRESTDIDIAVPEGCAKDFAVFLSEALEAHFVSLDEVNNIYRVVLGDKVTYIDIADIAGADIYEDLKRRDFTVNALGYDLKTGELIDVNNGVEDLNNRILREISEKNILDDPLRILRAFRFQSELGFEISEELCRLVRLHFEKINQSAKERVNSEIVKLFGGKYADETLFAMDDAGVLELIFPIVKELKKVPPNAHHHLRLFEHCVESVKQLQKFYEEAPKEVKEHFDSCTFGQCKRLAYLKLAGFLHDIGKPKTWEIEPDTGKHRFIKHDDTGSKMAPSILKELKFSNKQIKYVQKIIKYHMYGSAVLSGGEVSDKVIMRFFRKMEDDVFDIVAIGCADRLSTLGPEITEQMVESNLCGLKMLMNRYIDVQNEIAPLPKLLDGNEIMEILKIPAGKKLGEIINALHEAQMNGDVVSKEDAQTFIKNLS